MIEDAAQCRVSKSTTSHLADFDHKFQRGQSYLKGVGVVIRLVREVIHFGATKDVLESNIGALVVRIVTERPSQPINPICTGYLMRSQLSMYSLLLSPICLTVLLSLKERRLPSHLP